MYLVLGYIRPKLLHGNVSMYEDTFGRTGATIIIKENKKKYTTSKKAEISKDNNKPDFCKDVP